MKQLKALVFRVLEGAAVRLLVMLVVLLLAAGAEAHRKYFNPADQEEAQQPNNSGEL